MGLYISFIIFNDMKYSFKSSFDAIIYYLIFLGITLLLKN